MMDSIGLNNRRPGNQSALDKKKKKKRKKRTREGKRSSASSASASGSPDSTGPRQPKAQASQSCPNIVGMNTKENAQPDDSLDFKNDSQINECLRWPAHSLYVENSFKTEIIGKFPVSGLTEDEESERIAIYKMNRRKRYLAAQQALINKYPDVGIYASSSGSSSGHDTNEDMIKMSGSRNVVPSSDAKTLFHSTTQNALSDANNQENIQLKYFSNGDATPNARNGDAPSTMADNRKKVFSGI